MSALKQKVARKTGLPLTKQGNDYIAGDGSCSVKIHTTSGSITVNAKEN